MCAWGSYWGGSWAGGPTRGAFVVLEAAAVGARVVRVTFSQVPLWHTPIGRYDAASLERWALERLDTGRSLPLLGTRLTLEDAFAVELLLAEPFLESSLLAYRVTANQLHSASGNLLVGPASADFFGMPSAREVLERQRPLVDLLNPQTSGTRLNGSLQVGTDGDYALESGDGLIRKLIVRRILTALDEYYHLADTNYGAGLSSKQLLRPGDLIVLRTQLEAQISQEPGLTSVSVALSLARSGRLDVSVSAAVVTTGAQVSVQFPLNPSGGSQLG